MLGAQIADPGPGFSALRISQGVIRIKSNRLIEEADRLAVIFHISPCEIKMALQIRVVRFDILRRRVGGGCIFPEQCQLE